MNCSDYLVDFWIKHGVTDVFGYAGGYIVPVMDALYRRKAEINTHVCYNEQACAFAADGYARVSGKLGVYFTTSGPGAVNAFGGLADAWFDGVPIMGVSGNTPSTEVKGSSGLRQYGFQEMEVKSVVESFTKYSVTPHGADEFKKVLSIAYNSALLGRKGSVLIDFPLDVQQASIDCR